MEQSTATELTTGHETEIGEQKKHRGFVTFIEEPNNPNYPRPALHIQDTMPVLNSEKNRLDAGDTVVFDDNEIGVYLGYIEYDDEIELREKAHKIMFKHEIK